jgi:hypothetical protein
MRLLDLREVDNKYTNSLHQSVQLTSPEVERVGDGGACRAPVRAETKLCVGSGRDRGVACCSGVREEGSGITTCHSMTPISNPPEEQVVRSRVMVVQLLLLLLL